MSDTELEKALLEYSKVRSNVMPQGSDSGLEALRHADIIMKSIMSGKQIDLAYFKILINEINNLSETSKPVRVIKNQRKSVRMRKLESQKKD